MLWKTTTSAAMSKTDLAAALDQFGPDVSMNLYRIGNNFQAGLQDRGPKPDPTYPSAWVFRGGKTPSEALLAACEAMVEARAERFSRPGKVDPQITPSILDADIDDLI